MTILHNSGDLLAQTGIIVHGCNCLGKMGAGVARLIRNKYPFAFETYWRRYEDFGLQLGDIIAVAHPAMRRRLPELMRHVSKFDSSIPDGTIIVNAMTQYDHATDAHAGDKRVYVDYPAVESAFARIRMLAQASQLPVHYPLVGCGLARGKWPEVSARIERAMAGVDSNLWLVPGTSAA